MQTLKFENYAFVPTCNKAMLQVLEQKGYKNVNTYAGDYVMVRTTESPKYSSQVKCTDWGTDGVDWFSGTHYYAITREQYESMEIKPQLTPQYKPNRYHNFDGFVEQVSKEHRGLGWIEQWGNDFHKEENHRAVFFVTD